MKKIFFTLIGLVLCAFAFAQNQVVVVDYFTSPSSKSSDVTNLRNHIIEGIYETGRVTLIDVDTEASLAKEASRRTSESSLADQTARLGVMKTLGADFLLTGSATVIKTEKDDNRYKGHLVFTLKVVSAENGAIVGSETYEFSGSASTPAIAITECFEKAKKAMAAFVSKFFKAKGTIVEMGEIKNGKPETCYINLGASSGLEKGQVLIVNEVKMIAGVEGVEPIGKLKVEAVVADELAKCSVADGASEILTAFQTGHELRVITKQKKETGRHMAEVGRDVAEAGRKAAKVGRTVLEIGREVNDVIKILK